MQTGISAASLYPLETEKALILLSKLGYNVFEIFINAFAELEPEYCDMLNRLQKACGFRIHSVHPFTSALESMLLFERYDRRTEEGFALYRKYMEAAKRLGAEIVALHGQRIGAGKLTDAEYYERYHKLYLMGKELGVTFAQENVRQFRSASPDFIRGMRAHLGDECAFVLDIKQAVLSGVDPHDMLETMGTQLCHVHLSDHSEKGSCLLPGEGNFDFARLRTKLDALQYTGAVITEVYRDVIADDDSLRRSKSCMDTHFL